MGFGIDLVNRIDQVLADTGRTRKEFGEKLGIVQSTLATWKSRDICPPAETLSKIADELEVSLDWLLNGYKFETLQNMIGGFSRKDIRSRIYDLMLKKLNLKDGDLKKLHEENPDLIGVSYQQLLNWEKGRFELDLYIFQMMSFNLNTSIQYILAGNTAEAPANFNPVLYKAASENSDSVLCLYNLSDDKKKIVGEMLDKLMELEHLEHVSKK